MQKKGRRGRLQHSPKPSIEKRIADLTDKFDGDTQRLRAQLIFDLKTLLDIAMEQALSTGGRQTQERQNWAKLATYITQVINGISKTYDITQIKTELEQLRKTIGELEKQ
jgi:hypothetical protein